MLTSFKMQSKFVANKTFTIFAQNSNYTPKATQCKQQHTGDTTLEIAVYNVSTALKVVALL
jgi:hypothetical protein